MTDTMTDTAPGQELLRLHNVSQSYRKDAGPEALVLDGISLTLHEGEIVGVIGRSGSGKSSLLRIMGGLLRPASGSVLLRSSPLTGPVPDIGMAFQSFALFPWLDVMENITLPLEARGMSRSEREKHAEDIIRLTGLDGYAGAWPRELSPGLAQRAGLARALISRPDILLMDEPFAELDILTAENLRTDLVELWAESRLPCRSVLLVTHNVDEAVLMCDRIIVFSANPGRVEHELLVPFAHPRDRETPEFRDFVDDIYGLMTRRAPVISEACLPAQTAAPAARSLSPLPPVPVESIIGLIEALAASPLDGRADLPQLATRSHLELDDLFPLTEALQLLDMAELEDGDILLTREGGRFAGSGAEERRAILRHALLRGLPIIREIRAMLDERPSRAAPAETFRNMLETDMSADYAAQTLQTLTDWSRYAGLFDYDEESDRLFLNEEE
ncbi:nitrate/sulfonate/bicarbonate ABC transporter ATP-binding protein [Acetobacter sp. AN02]|uniref:ABC transporter ATP-binding protein n=1 Tax=Acetobacter sp. AN02 TaxID=2894186 RepID=UPI0024341137|nr:nitrate/sulfonate/bicarbonate ABC transporter ATP-binding protein [Acetobacter sp. AN02]MDG6095047.1 nitrate/sulfonate/bicarbonate ABC transporter ATP-binding protein [Acetobacter sp. AN02]